MLANLRKIIHDAHREIMRNGMDGLCVLVSRWAHLRGQRSQGQGKLTFSLGASLSDPYKLSTPTLKAIDGERLISTRVTARVAVDYNQIKLNRKAPAVTRPKEHKSKK